MGKRLDDLEERYGKLKKAHKKLQSVVQEIAEAVDEIADFPDKVDGLDIVSGRHKKRIAKLEIKLDEMLSEAKNSTGKIDKTVKDLAWIHVHNQKHAIMKKLIEMTALDFFKELAKKTVRVRTKTFTDDTFKVSLFDKLGNRGYKLAGILEPPAVKERLYVFQKEIITLQEKKKKKIKRSPA